MWFLLACAAPSTQDSAGLWTEVQREPSVPSLPAMAAPISLVHPLVSGFAPRRLSNDEDRTDLHLGVDYEAPTGTVVYAVAEGTVYRVKPPEDEDDPATLYLELPIPPVDFHGHQVDRVFAVYSHMVDFLVEEGQSVAAGQEVAFVGESGANSPHLHLELRLGTPCSLRYASENPDSSCARDYDPAVNPLHALPPSVEGQLEPSLLSLDPLVLKLRHPEGAFVFNRLASDAGVLDLDLREGIDATSEAALDDMDYGWVELSPDRRSDEEDAQGYTLRFAEPVAWVELLDLEGRGWRLELP